MLAQELGKQGILVNCIQAGVTDTPALRKIPGNEKIVDCLLYTSDAADERSSVDLGGRRIIKKKQTQHTHTHTHNTQHNKSKTE